MLKIGQKPLFFKKSVVLLSEVVLSLSEKFVFRNLLI
jgi:hypothetical protein